ERRSRSLPVLFPAGIKERLILDHRPAKLEPVLVLRPRRLLVWLVVREFKLLVEVLVGVQNSSAQVFIRGTVPTVGAGLRAQVDHAAGELAPFGALIVVLNFVFADG